MAEVVVAAVRAAREAGLRPGLRRLVRGRAEPRRDRRRQGPAVGGAGGAAAVRPAADGRDRAREAGRGGVRARAGRTRSCSTASSPGLQLLQRVRDEAHRFALGFHRQRRDARAVESIFDTLQGVGPARRRALLRHFGSPERFLAASRGGARGRARHPGEDGALDLRAAAQGRPRLARTVQNGHVTVPGTGPWPERPRRLGRVPGPVPGTRPGIDTPTYESAPNCVPVFATIDPQRLRRMPHCLRAPARPRPFRPCPGACPRDTARTDMSPCLAPGRGS